MRGDPNKPNRILVRGVNWLGDAVMTTPALMSLREAHPGAHIALLTPDKLADLWRHHPAVDEVLSFTRRDGLLQTARRLRELLFDAAVAFPNSHRSALELWWARIPRRVGYAAPLRNLLLTDPVPHPVGRMRMRKRSVSEIRSRRRAGAALGAFCIPEGAHHVHHYLLLASVLGGRVAMQEPRLQVTDAEVRAAAEKFWAGTDERLPLVGVNPGAEYGPAKRWPIDRFAALVQRVQQLRPCRWLLLGGPGDVALVQGLAAELSQAGLAPITLAGRMSLRELCAVLWTCRAVVTNDTGPMHVAAALGTPVVALFGSTAKELTAPGLPGDPRHRILHAKVPCSPCFLRECPVDFKCMTDLTVDRVAEALISVLADWRKPN